MSSSANIHTKSVTDSMNIFDTGSSFTPWICSSFAKTASVKLCYVERICMQSHDTAQSWSSAWCIAYKALPISQNVSHAEESAILMSYVTTSSHTMLSSFRQAINASHNSGKTGRNTFVSWTCPVFKIT
jgi:hypothetical protein